MSPSAIPDVDPPSRHPAPAPRKLPAGTCDAHMHVFGPPVRYPLDERRGYTPHPASLDQYREVMAALGIARAVIVQPSVYGTDHAMLLDTLRAAGPAFRGVAVPHPRIAQSELRALHEAGVRGIRLNLVNTPVVDADETLAILHEMASSGWHLQVFADMNAQGAELERLCGRIDAPVVIDHMGRLDPATADSPVLGLLREGRCWVKLSAPYRVSRRPAPHEDLAPMVERLMRANPARLLWGSDWPHTEQHGAVPSAASLAELLHRWLPDADLLRRVCVDNPGALYLFDPPLP